MKKGAYSEAMEDAGYSTEPVRPWGCCHVAGCVMPGTMTSSTSGTSEWFCRFHFGAPAATWGDITARVANRQALFDVGRSLSASTPNTTISTAAIRTIEAARRRDLLELPADKKRTARNLGRHMMAVLENEVKRPQQQPQMGTMGELIAESEEIGA
ncbi:hypothetical protein [Pigmentiphaga daeguensis]|uniref:Phage protein n=1 Tax=Pigmentiphaga daeguensis TaxID=414049 RepID=A0ABN1D5S2_9BURK